MSHIDAKAETKGVEAGSPCAYCIAMGDAQCSYSDGCRSEISPSLAPPEPQPHTRINSNGKSCGEFNCDTCHPVEEALPYEWSESDQARAREVMAARDRAGFAYDRDDFLHTLSFTQMRERQFREALNRITGLEEAVHGWGEVFRTMKIRAEKAEAELAALKATPKEDAGDIELELRRMMWLGHGHTGMYGDDGEMQCGECAPFGIYDYRREPLDKVRDAFRAAQMLRLSAAQSSPSLPLEEPEQLMSDDELATAIAYAEEHKSAYLPALIELQNRRALAARRGGR